MELEQLEALALSEDREAALARLIPGTEDDYFHRTLALLHRGQLDATEPLIQAWVARYGETARVQQLRDRRAVLGFERDPAGSREHLRRRLGLTFSDQREVEDAASTLPTRLDPAAIARERFLADALRHHPGLDGFEDRAFEWLVGAAELDQGRARALLSRLERPDYPGLLERLVAELRSPNSAGFGQLEIHARLTLAQLDALASALPSLLEQPAFVEQRLARLLPGPEVDLDEDLDARAAHLERLWAAVEGLAPAFVSLQAHVRYHQLDLDRRQDRYDRARFEAYLRLPRDTGLLPDTRRRTIQRDQLAQLDRDYRAWTGLAPVADDRELIADYLRVLFADPELADHRGYAAWVDEDYLRRSFAEAKLLAGVGEAERWYALLDDPQRIRELERHVAIDLAPHNPRRWAADAPVELVVDLQRVPVLVVKVFEIDPLAYFLAHGREVEAHVDLDGLVANDEQVLELDAPPLRRIRETLSFPSLARPGTFIIELIGGGKSSRAVIRKGGLRLLDRRTAAGHALTVLDEQDRVIESGASLWIGGREFVASADDAGEIRVPYKPLEDLFGTHRALVRAGDRAAVVPLSIAEERYELRGGVHVEREALIAGATAELVIATTLTVAGVRVPIELLREPKLRIDAEDRQGVRASTTVALELHRREGGAGEAVHPFKVPEGLRRLEFEVRGEVRSLTEGRDLSLSLSRRVEINGLDASSETADLHLRPSADGPDTRYVLLVLGKSGEPRAGVEVTVDLRHLDFIARMQLRLQTDASGRIELGELVDIAELTAKLASGRERSWTLTRALELPAELHLGAGETAILPRPRASGSLPELVSLLERRGDGYVRDCIDAVRLADDGVHVHGLTPGDYELRYRLDRGDGSERAATTILRVSPASAPVRGWLLGPRRQLEATRPELLRIRGLRCDAETLTVEIAGADADARVHVFARRFLPDHARAAAALDHARDAEPEVRPVPRVRSSYLSGRDIGDEVRYILDRRRASPRLGNLAERPGLLLNPWSLRTTKTGTATALAGSAYAAEHEELLDDEEGYARAISRKARPRTSTSYDFLANPATLARGGSAGFEPDADGRVAIPRAALGEATFLEVVVVDGGGQAAAELALPEAPITVRDRRLLDSLDPEGHFVLRKHHAALAPGAELILADPRTARFELVDSVAKAYALLSTLADHEDPELGAQLREFEFLTRWPALSPEDKRERYGKYACHELDLFLARKDPEWFAELVQPYLAHKRARGFIDDYLLGEELERYRAPWAYARLNALEKALLAQRIAGEGGPTARHLRERCELLAPDVEGDRAAFDTVLQGSALDQSSGEGGGGQGPALEPAPQAASLGMAFGGGPGRGGSGGPPPPRSAAAPAPAAPPAPPAPSPSRKRAAKAKAASYRGPADLAAREQVRRFYQPLDKTEEWAEQHYYRRPIAEQGPELIPIRGFWRDYAEHLAAGSPGPFLSGEFVRATDSLAELLCALAVLDLPFEAEPPAREADPHSGALRVRAKTPVIAFHEQIAAVDPAAASADASASAGAGVLVSANIFRADDRYRFEGNERHDKPVTGELLIHTVYLCQVILTNPSSAAHSLALLLQIPQGAIPVADGFETRDVHVHLEPRATHALEFGFYFPIPGRFPQFPVHVGKRGELVAFAEPRELVVLASPRTVDAASWTHISQRADDATLLAYLDAHNLERLDLRRIAWRMRAPAMFAATLELLRRRHVYADALWSYAVLHGDRLALGEYLGQQDGFLRGCGLALETDLVSTDAVARRWYQHLEYAPLVNARVHPLGGQRTILNSALAEQWRALLATLIDAASPSDDQWLAAVYYLLVQDRYDEAERLLARIDPARITGRLQWDYLHAWLALGRGELDRARELAEPWSEHPVPRWRRRFSKLLAMLPDSSSPSAAADGAGPTPEDEGGPDNTELAASEASVDFEVEGEVLVISHSGLTQCELRGYRMDIELLFSRQPFMADQSERFAIVRPNFSEALELAGPSPTRIPLPAPLRHQNTILELVAPGVRRSKANYAHDLAVRLVEAYGQLWVAQRSTGAPLGRAYVKVYGRRGDRGGGSVEFIKDGYTDLRGAFDYAALSTKAMDEVERLAILVHTAEHGALIREAKPPRGC